ncbi:hypothetical protein DFJ74DRAFT_713494 [Hyaloraphidium curvatum]|nr:hypothetical protein DFJ74DRAFT_713494 [Hyaloraphidium curvatum]
MTRPTREQLLKKDDDFLAILNDGRWDQLGPYSSGKPAVLVGTTGIFVGKDEVEAALKRFMEVFQPRYERVAPSEIILDVAPGVHSGVNHLRIERNDLAGGRTTVNVTNIHFFNDAVEVLRSYSCFADEAGALAAQQAATRASGGTLPGAAEAQAALNKLIAFNDVQDAAGVVGLLADDAVMIAPWFKVLIGKDAVAEFTRKTFEGGLTGAKIVSEPQSLEPWTAVARVEFTNEGMFTIGKTASPYRVQLDPASGKIKKIAVFVDDVAGVETMRKLCNPAVFSFDISGKGHPHEQPATLATPDAGTHVPLHAAAGIDAWDINKAKENPAVFSFDVNGKGHPHEQPATLVSPDAGKQVPAHAAAGIDEWDINKGA